MKQSSKKTDAVKGYKVSIKSTETVLPADPVPVHNLPLSNLDILLPQIYPAMYFLFKNPSPPYKKGTVVCDLKVALAKVLVGYYPLAGEVVGGTTAPAEVCCNNRGVDFIEAYADVSLRELNLYNPDESVEDKLVPKHRGGIISIQVTELQCGGFVIALTSDHRFLDGFSCFMFISAWAETALSRPLSRIPCFCRSLISSCCNFSMTSSYSVADQFLVTRSSIPPREVSSPSTLINRTYFIQRSDITSLQALVGNRHTKMVSFTAYFWHLIAKSAMPHQKSCSIGMIVNGRSRFQSARNLNAMSNYFGNVIAAPYGTLEVAKLREMNLADVAEEVTKWLAPALTKDYFKGVVNWVEAHHRQPAVERLFTGDLRKSNDQIACCVSSYRGYPEIDFGWGRTVFCSSHFPRAQGVGTVVTNPRKTTGDWAVYVQVPACVVEVMEQQPSIFQPMKPEYYMLNEKKARL